jgi:hypothetical protein
MAKISWVWWITAFSLIILSTSVRAEVYIYKCGDGNSMSVNFENQTIALFAANSVPDPGSDVAIDNTYIYFGLDDNQIKHRLEYRTGQEDYWEPEVSTEGGTWKVMVNCSLAR